MDRIESSDEGIKMGRPDDYRMKRDRNNESARKCREKRKKLMIGHLEEAKEMVDFNRFIRKELLEFYQTSSVWVPSTSMLFTDGRLATDLGLGHIIKIIYR